MPSNSLNQRVRQTSTAKGQSTVRSCRTNRKAAGTRWGTLENWRAASNGAKNASGRYGQTIRDGGQ
jgi:hypothetical protein